MESKKKLKESTSYDLHGALDFLLVECAVSNRSMAKRFCVPYKNVLAEGQDPAFASSELEVVISVQWNGKLTKGPANLPEPDKGNPQ